MPVEITKNFVRIKVRNLGVFKSGTFQTHDIGRPGHALRIAAIRKKTGRFATQSFLIPRKDIRKLTPATRRLLANIRKRHKITLRIGQLKRIGL